MPRKITQEEFIIKASKKHNNKYDYSATIYTLASEKIIVKCPVEGHGIFKPEANNHIRGSGCPICAGFNKTTNCFTSEAKLIHGDNYDYSKTIYKKAKEKVIITCKKENHGDFEQTPNNHLNGVGCPKCAGLHKTTEYFIQEAKLIHGDKYIYSSADYKKADEKIIIICPIHGHGLFEQTPSCHLSGQGCPKCGSFGKNMSNTTEFIEKAKKIHGDRYDYSKVDYTNCKTKIIIICQKNHQFNQIPSDHLAGYGCPYCVSIISKPETEWLDSMNIRPENRQVKILKYKIDGYDPETNTIYEFNGDFWHGNPAKYNQNDINPKAQKTYGWLYEKTLLREQKLKSAGYNVISIWESDFIRN